VGRTRSAGRLIGKKRWASVGELFILKRLAWRGGGENGGKGKNSGQELLSEWVSEVWRRERVGGVRTVVWEAGGDKQWARCGVRVVGELFILK